MDVAGEECSKVPHDGAKTVLNPVSISFRPASSQSEEDWVTGPQFTYSPRVPRHIWRKDRDTVAELGNESVQAGMDKPSLTDAGASVITQIANRAVQAS